MKKLIPVLLILLVAVASIAQDKTKEKKGKVKGKGKATEASFKRVEIAEVPDAVKNAFNTQAAGVTNVRWERHAAKGKADKTFTKFVAVYMQDGVRSRSRFREDGTPLSSSRYMGAQKLPEAISSSAKTKNPGFELVGGEEVKTKKGETFYRVRMKKGSSKLTSLYDANGNEVTRDKQEEDVMEDEGDDGN